MKITYANNRVKKYFEDFSKMKRKLPEDWVRKIKKHINNLKAAETFGDFLSLGLGKPELLTVNLNENPRYSLHVSANVRLIIEPNIEQDSVMICEEVEVEGVCDYHGEKENWYIP